MLLSILYICYVFVIMSVAWEKLPHYHEGKLTTNYPVVQAIHLLFL